MNGTAYIRIHRDGRWQNLPFEHLTKEEIAERFTEPVAAGWIDYLARKVRDFEAFLESEGYVLAEPDTEDS